MFAKFVKKSETCVHGGNGSCSRCAMEDVEDGVKLYSEMNTNFVYECVAHLPPYLNERMREHGTSLVLAGGFIRDVSSGHRFQDVDLFASSVHLASTLSNYVNKTYQSTVFERDRLYSVTWGGVEYQFHYGYKFKSVEDLLNQFDLSIARAAVWYTGKDWTGIHWHTWLQDSAAKKLVCLSREPEIEIALRLLRFTARGYSIDVANLSHVIASIVGATPSALELDLNKLEQELVEGFEKMQKRAKVEASPFRKVERQWDSS